MAKTESEERADNAIKHNLMALEGYLALAAEQAREAAGAARGFDPASRTANAPDTNRAIGTLIGIEEKLEAALALYKAALALHRTK